MGICVWFCCVFITRVRWRPRRYFWKLLSANLRPTGRRLTRHNDLHVPHEAAAIKQERVGGETQQRRDGSIPTARRWG